MSFRDPVCGCENPDKRAYAVKKTHFPTKHMGDTHTHVIYLCCMQIFCRYHKQKAPNIKKLNEKILKRRKKDGRED